MPPCRLLVPPLLALTCLVDPHLSVTLVSTVLLLLLLPCQPFVVVHLPDDLWSSVGKAVCVLGVSVLTQTAVTSCRCSPGFLSVEPVCRPVVSTPAYGLPPEDGAYFT
ncbi:MULTISPECIES: hypothetical protein [Photobacterium]|uniref:Uncharacterized protein n=1 Tax=Photobacterium ganghwense TaxID=320778 RepID=A0A0J1H2S7_9GAMM|nr:MULTISPECIES: hypothetical protein [Photobacterium]KLV06098.1 hypothetical protein ABT57_20285 [Photobacterium ganghwense]MBV1840000.1 hypothetical protein [Photobacterium ganghwense]QSV14006.1 hypothetical protein FH974_15365 [Photobacterium ganghwense]